MAQALDRGGESAPKLLGPSGWHWREADTERERERIEEVLEKVSTLQINSGSTSFESRVTAKSQHARKFAPKTRANTKVLTAPRTQNDFLAKIGFTADLGKAESESKSPNGGRRYGQAEHREPFASTS